MIKNWKQGFHECNIDTEKRQFLCVLPDEPFDENKSFLDIVYDILKDVPKPVEILYSGGKDSELVLYSCLILKIPFVAVTMEFVHKDKILNTHDMYYAQKFCLANNIKQKIIKLDVTDLYHSQKYIEYLKKFHIKLPHVASHLYAIENCESFPIIAGYWPWVQVKDVDSVLSPIRCDFSSYEEFMKEKNMSGIGNFLSHNLEITHFLCKKHLKLYSQGDEEADLKYKMYKEIMPNIEPRYKSMGWELKIPDFNINDFNTKLTYFQTNLIPKISWGTKLCTLLNTTKTNNDKFK